MRNRMFLIFALLLAPVAFLAAQNVGIGTNSPNPSAQLEISSTSKGLLPPRMTYAQRNAIVNPATGLMVYCTDCDSSGQPQCYNGTHWCNMLGAVASAPLPQIANLSSVTIGTQIWSSKNLDVAIYRNGDLIPQVTDPLQWATLTTGAWCWYNNDSATYATTFGRLYNWYAVNDPRGLAPWGWHVPLDAEWNKLVKYIDAGADTVCQGCSQSSTAGGAMKSITDWNSPNTNATNSSGFAGLPGGFRYSSGTFGNVGYYGFWWTAREYDTAYAWYRSLYSSNSGVYRNFYYKTYGFTVRVVRD